MSKTNLNAFLEACRDELNHQVQMLLTVATKLETSVTPQGKNLYSKKIKKIRANIERLSKVVAAAKDE